MSPNREQRLTQLWIVGPVCIGKSTLAASLAEQLNLPLINENISGGLAGMIERIAASPIAIVEHCHLLEMVAYRWLQPDASPVLNALHRINLAVIILTGSETLLSANLNARLAAGGVGDFQGIDPIEMQTTIEQAQLAFQAQYPGVEISRLFVADREGYRAVESASLAMAQRFFGERIEVRPLHVDEGFAGADLRSAGRGAERERRDFSPPR